MITIRNRRKSFIINKNSISNRTFLHAHQIVSFLACLDAPRAAHSSACFSQTRCIPNRHIPLLEFDATYSKQRALLMSNRHTSAFFLSRRSLTSLPVRRSRSERVLSFTSSAPFASDNPDRDCHPELVEGFCFLCLLCLPSFPPSWYFLPGQSEKREVQST